MAQTGRPLREFDRKTFENLCELQCTEKEICDFFETTDKTLIAWIKRTYKDEVENPSFSEVFEKYAASGKISLRRYQFRLAEKSATMAIWLGKQYLGQKDMQTIQMQEIEADPLSTAFESFEHGEL